MPLAFDSTSHGTIAFGFFNIESDMLLLERNFFFSTDFCACMARLCQSGRAERIILPGFVIDDPSAAGDLHGAIQGVRFTGFIGELYRSFPFPDAPGDFKQNPDSHRTQTLVRDLIGRYGRPCDIPIEPELEGAGCTIGGIRFSRPNFHELIAYVWLGGYPRWRNEVRPAHVKTMKTGIEACRMGLFQGIVFPA